MKETTILIIDDEEAQLQSLKSFLGKREFRVFTANSGETGYKIFSEHIIDIVLTDFKMPGWDGLTTIKNIKSLNPEIDIIAMSAYGEIENVVELMKAGAYDYLIKPIDLDALENLLNKIKEKQTLISENKMLKAQIFEKFNFESIITQSKLMEKSLSEALRAAQTKSTTLLRGESGSGKELLARAIHYSSPRKDKPFVVVNIASLPENLIESELFGHEKGSFTGALYARIGRFEEANGGTLFIDEAGDIPLTAQVKLLRAIQFGEFQRIGSGQTQKSDVRFIAATHQNLESMIKTGAFREDLYYRLNVISITIPPLRERREDIPLLIDHFIKKYSSDASKKINGVSLEAFDRLIKYNYPGNIRELENIIERAVAFTRNQIISTEDLPLNIDFPDSSKMLDPNNFEDDYENKMAAFESKMINEALARAEGNKSAAARLLNITERHLRSRLERLNIKNKRGDV